MKKVFLTLVMILMTVPALAGKDRGGGNSVEIEFKGIGFTIAGELEAMPMFDTLGIDTTKFRFAVGSVEIVPAKSLMLDGKIKEAINIPAKGVVQVDEDNWNQLTDRRKQILVMHEILSLMGNQQEQATYSVSTQFFALLDRPDIQAAIHASQNCKSEASLAAMYHQIETYPQFHPQFSILNPVGVSLPGLSSDNSSIIAFIIYLDDHVAPAAKWLVIIDNQSTCHVSTVMKAM